MTRHLPALLGASCLLAAAGAAQAQPYDYGTSNVGGVTVYAPRVVGRSSIGAPIVLARESRFVRVADLNLATGWGAHVLRDRIHQAAREACDDLDARYGGTEDQAPDDCVRSAVRAAMYNVEYQIGYAPPAWPGYY